MSDDDPRIELVGKEFTVTASEKISTGEYENYEPFASIEGEMTLPESHADGVPLTDEQREKVQQRLLDLHRDLQEVLERAAGNRVAIADMENWDISDDPDEFDESRPGQ